MVRLATPLVGWGGGVAGGEKLREGASLTWGMDPHQSRILPALFHVQIALPAFSTLFEPVLGIFRRERGGNYFPVFCFIALYHPAASPIFF